MSGALSVHALVRAWAAETPEAVAIAAPEHIPLTYTRLLRQIEKTAQVLNGLGLGRNARVAVVLPNGPEAAVAFLAVAACATCAPLNPALRAREFDQLLAGLGVRALVAQDGVDSPAVTAARKRGIPVIRLRPQPESGAGMFTLEGARLGRAAPSGFAPDQDLALTLSTSGTTARPKVVPLTQANVCIAADNVRRALALSPADRCLNVMPLFHVHGLIGAVLSSIAAGGSVICTPGYSCAQFSRSGSSGHCSDLVHSGTHDPPGRPRQHRQRSRAGSHAGTCGSYARVPRRCRRELRRAGADISGPGHPGVWNDRGRPPDREQSAAAARAEARLRRRARRRGGGRRELGRRGGAARRTRGDRDSRRERHPGLRRRRRVGSAGTYRGVAQDR